MLKKLIVTAACGAVASAALPPHTMWPFALALVPLFVLVALSKRTRESFWRGYVFALAFFTLYLLWIPLSFSKTLGSRFWIAFPIIVNWLAIIWGSTTALCRWVAGPGTRTLWLLPAAWVIVEWIRGQGYLAFPWGTFGYIWLDTPIAQFADIIGVYGLSLITTVLAALLAIPFVNTILSFRSKQGLFRILVLLVIPLLFWGILWNLGLTRSKIAFPSSPATALLVQANTNPLDRTIDLENEMLIHRNLTTKKLLAKDAPQLVVWPEGAIGGLNVVGSLGKENREEIQASALSSTFIIGGRTQHERGSFNSAYSLSNASIDDRYDKVFLVPFGERWPLIDSAASVYRTIFKILNLPFLQNTSPGIMVRPISTQLGLIGAYICYESVFPQVQRTMVRQGARVLINITNDAWFSRGNGAQQHFEMGRLRAIETRRYLLRAGNDGITAAIDPFGTIVSQLQQGITAALPVRFELIELKTVWVRYGHLFIPVVLTYFMLASLLLWIRRH